VEPLSQNELRLWDICEYYGNSCNPACDYLQRRISNARIEDHLPHSLYSGMSEQFGWWWHYMLNTAPGWWNRDGQEHVTFKTMVGITFGVELGAALQNYEFVAAASEAFARKSWGEGFYRFIGGRQSVTMRVNDVIYPGNPDDWTYAGYDPAKFTRQINIDTSAYDIRGVAYKSAADILYSQDWREVVYNKPYEWGNPTERSPEDFLGALRDGNEGIGPRQVYYFSEPYIPSGSDSTPFIIVDGLKIYAIEYVVTQEQQFNLCNNASCVSP